MITGKMILQDEIIEAIAECAWFFVSVEALKQHVYWHFADDFGQQVVDAVGAVLHNLPDSSQEAKQLQECECTLKALLKMAKRDLQDKLSKIQEACFLAVTSVKDGP